MSGLKVYWHLHGMVFACRKRLWDQTLTTLQFLWFLGDRTSCNENWPMEVFDTQARVAVKVLDYLGMSCMQYHEYSLSCFSQLFQQILLRSHACQGLKGIEALLRKMLAASWMKWRLLEILFAHLWMNPRRSFILYRVTVSCCNCSIWQRPYIIGWHIGLKKYNSELSRIWFVQPDLSCSNF